VSLVLIGVGNAAIAVNNFATGRGYDTVYGTTRQPDKVDTLRRKNIQPILLNSPMSAESLIQLEQFCEDAHVLVSFPPSGSVDQEIASALQSARKIVYISSTGVYGGTSGIITETSAVESDNPSIQPRLQAESIWTSQGAIVLRAPALYGPDYGLHLSLKAGKFKIPGDGNRYSSRIHLDDLASIIFEALRHAAPGSTYVVGDDRPATHREVVTWLCKRMSIDLPGSIPLEQAHVTLRANRQILADKIKADLGIALKYPTYVEGFIQCLGTG
jgi:hypothetical protein